MWSWSNTSLEGFLFLQGTHLGQTAYFLPFISSHISNLHVWILPTVTQIKPNSKTLCNRTCRKYTSRHSKQASIQGKSSVKSEMCFFCSSSFVSLYLLILLPAFLSVSYWYRANTQDMKGRCDWVTVHQCIDLAWCPEAAMDSRRRREGRAAGSE